MTATTPVRTPFTAQSHEAGRNQPGTRRGVAAYALDPEAAARLITGSSRGFGWCGDVAAVERPGASYQPAAGCLRGRRAFVRRVWSSSRRAW